MDSIDFEIILKYIGALSLILGIFWSLYKAYDRFVKPRRKIVKYHKLFELIDDWFDEIDKNLEEDLNLSLMNNKETKIRQYIYDNKLSNDKMFFKKKFRFNYLKSCGISSQYASDKIRFFRYARVNDNWAYLEVYINSLFGAFYAFFSNYKLKIKNTNFAEIEMRVKFLKNYFGYKRK